MPDYFKSPVAIPATGAGMPAAPLCPGDLPLVLLPVRLETRFFTLANDLTDRGWPAKRVEKILGANFARLFGEVWG